jgi:preprotein translocase subunit SecY
MKELLNSGSSLALMDLLGGGALSSFSIFALGVSPYITAQIIIQLLSKDVLARPHGVIQAGRVRS